MRSVCALTDPFCEHARGAMYPDSTAGKVVTESIRFMFQPTNDASGDGLICFQGNPFYPYIGGTRSGSTWTLSPNYSILPYNSLLGDYGSSVRIVTWGVRVFNVASATNSSGMLMGFTGGQLTPGADITQTPSAYNRTLMAPLKHGAEFTFASRPFGPDARTFIDVATLAVNTYTVEDWETVIFTWWGGPASVNSLVFEFVCNVEYTLGTSSHAASALSAIARQSPAQNLQLSTATSAVQSNLDNLVAKTTEGFGKGVENAVGAILYRAGSAAVGAAAGYLFGGPAGAARGAGTALLVN